MSISSYFINVIIKFSTGDLQDFNTRTLQLQAYMQGQTVYLSAGQVKSKVQFVHTTIHLFHEH